MSRRMTTQASKIAEEAAYFNRHDNQLTRQRNWSAIPLMQQRLQAAADLGGWARQALGQRTGLRCLTLACGNMAGEYGFLRRLGAARIDAFDISEEQKRKFLAQNYDGQVEVDYRIADVNEIQLQPDCYDLVYIQQAFHHFEAVEHVAAQIASSLKPDGVFVLIDYVGPNYLQRSSRQREVASRFWQHLPERYRTSGNKVWEEIYVPPRESLPPYEAIRSEAILPALRSNFVVEQMFLYGGLLFPLLNGFAQNFGDNEADQTLLQTLWETERLLEEAGAIEPNFIRAVLRKRP